jgi:proteasome lid subunit RPN8/RPN11
VIHLAPRIQESLIQAGQQAYPLEACGFLLGARQGQDLDIRALIPGSAKSLNGYSLTAEELWAAERKAFKASLTVLGFYHSHPDGEAQPSELDHAEALPGYLYAIIAIKGEEPPKIGFFQFDEATGSLTSL